MNKLGLQGMRDEGTDRTAPILPEPFPVPKVLAAAGIVGPILFAIGFLAQGVLRTDLRSGYNPMAQTISSLTAGPDGWVQQGNFIVLGVLVIAFAVGLSQGMQKTRRSVLGPALLAWNGVELVIAGLFPLREAATGRIFDPLGVHSVNGTIFFVCIGIVLVVVSWQFAQDARWRGLAAYTLISGIVLVVLVVMAKLLVAGAQAPLHPWEGLIQRVTISVWLLCLVVLALRLWRGAGTGARRRGERA